MSREIDDRVVSIEFDNSEFSGNVDNTIKNLDALEEKLSFKGATDGFAQIERAARDVNLNNIAQGVESLENRFSTMGIVGMRVVERLTDGVINLAGRMVSFATEGIIGGGERRAMNLENAKFTLDGLLKDTKKVDAVMANVQESVDGTAYGLDAAAVVASQLAASGMEAGDDLLHALKAISGVAAMTNSDFGEIGHIFTTIAGNGRLMTEQLNQLSYRGLNAAATLGEQLGKSEAEIREMVSDGKISFSEFAEAMNDAFGAQAKKANETFNGSLSNIKAALGRIGAKFVAPLIERNGPVVQLFNELRLQINSVNALLDPFVEKYTSSMGKAVNALIPWVHNFDTSGKSVRLFIEPLQILVNLLTTLYSVVKPIGQAFHDVFGSLPSDRFINLMNAVKSATGAMVLSGERAEDLRNTFKGLFSIVDLGIGIIYELANGLANIIEKSTGISGGLFAITSKLGQWFSSITDSMKKAGIIASTIRFIAEAFGDAGALLVQAGQNLREAIFSSKALEIIQDIFATIAGAVIRAAAEVTKFFANLTNAFSNVVKSGSATEVAKFIESTLVVGILTLLEGFFTKLMDFGDIADEFWKGMKRNFGNVARILYNIGETFRAWAVNINVRTLSKIGASILLIALAITIIANIPEDKLYNSIAAISALFGLMTLAMNSLMKNSAGFMKLFGYGGAFIGFATSIVILSIAFKEIADSVGDPEKTITALIAMATMVGLMAGVAWLMSAKGIKMTNAIQFIELAGALYIIGKALNVLGQMSWEQLAVALSAITVVFGELMGMVFLLAGDKKIKVGKLKSVGRSMLVLSAALSVFAKVLHGFAELSWDELAKGGAALAGVVAVMGIFARVMTESRALALLEAAGSLAIMSEAMQVFSEIAVTLSSLSWEGLGKAAAGLGMVIGLVTIYGFLAGLMSQIKFFTAAVSMILLGKGMEILAGVITTLADVSWENLGKALAGMSGIIALAVIYSSLSASTPLMGLASVALILFGAGMKIMADVVKTISDISWEGIIKAQYGIFAILAMLTVFSSLAQMNLAGMAVASASMIGFALAISILAPALMALSVVGFVGVGGALLGLALGMAAVCVVAQSLAIALPFILQFALAITLLASALGVAAVGFAKLAVAIASYAGLSKEQLGKVGTAMRETIKAVGAQIPDLFAGFAQGVIEFFATLFEAGKNVIIQLKDFIVEIFKMLIEIAPTIAQFIVVLLKDVLGLVAQNADEIFSSVWTLIVKLVESGAEFIPELVEAVLDLLKRVLEVVSEKGVSSLGEVAAVIGNTLGKAIGEVVGGLVEGFVSGAKDSLEAMGGALAMFGEGFSEFADQCRSVDDAALKGCLNMAAMIVAMTAADFISAIGQIVDFVLPGDMGSTLASYGAAIVQFSESISDLSEEDVNKAATAAKAGACLAGMADSFIAMKDLTGDEITGFMDNVDKMNRELIVSRFDEAVEAASGELDTLKSKLRSIGKLCVQGLAEGLSDQAELAKVKNAATDLGTMVANVVEDVMGIESPSKVMRKDGRYGSEGLALGLTDNVDKVEKASSKLGLAALSGTSGVAARIQELMDSDGSQPVITPVLDLSQIQNGANGISAMFDNPNLGFSASFDASNDQTNAYLIEQNNLLREMITAINSGGNVYIKDGPLIGWIDTKLGALT